MADTNTDTGSQETKKTLDVAINEALASADEKGIIPFEDNVDPVFKKLVLTEKKARQHQAKAIKAIQEATSLKATNQVLSETIKGSVVLTAEQTAELEDLKHTDPDEWFKKKTEYESVQKTATEAKLQELTEAAATTALKDLTLNERKEALESFQKRTGIVLTDDIMQNDIPPRLQAKINTVPFDDYLNEVATYLGKTKVVKQTDATLDQVNIGHLAGAGETTPPDTGKYTIL